MRKSPWIEQLEDALVPARMFRDGPRLLRKVTDLFVLGSGQFLPRIRLGCSIPLIGPNYSKISSVPPARSSESRIGRFPMPAATSLRIPRIRRRDRGCRTSAAALRTAWRGCPGGERQDPKPGSSAGQYPASKMLARGGDRCSGENRGNQLRWLCSTARNGGARFSYFGVSGAGAAGAAMSR